ETAFPYTGSPPKDEWRARSMPDWQSMNAITNPHASSPGIFCNSGGTSPCFRSPSEKGKPPMEAKDMTTTRTLIAALASIALITGSPALLADAGKGKGHDKG